MVDNVLSLSTKGIRDWIIQRITAIIIALYAFFILGFIILHPQMQFDEWQMIFSYGAVKIFSLLVLFSLILHAWIGIWTVCTDYLKSAYVRLILLVLIAILFFSCLAWGVVILWGI